MKKNNHINKVRAKRIENNMSADDAAKKLRLSRTSYYQKERGEKEFKLYEIQELLKLYKCTFEELF